MLKKEFSLKAFIVPKVAHSQPIRKPIPHQRPMSTAQNATGKEWDAVKCRQMGDRLQKPCQPPQRSPCFYDHSNKLSKDSSCILSPKLNHCITIGYIKHTLPRFLI